MLSSFINEFAEGNTAIFIENFIGVALIEEFFKYRVLKYFTWKHPAFNYHFDAIVYSVCVSMGLAILENIMYVSKYGFGTAIARMFISVPAHCIFAIYMGCYYGTAKSAAVFSKSESRRYLSLALCVPVLFHGFFDYTASLDTDWSALVFIVFVIVMDILSIRRIRRASKSDAPVY